MHDGPTDQVTVLHVDDDPNFTELVAEFLEREEDRFDVRSVTDVSAALDVVETGEVDCIVSDYNMPGRDGLEFLEAIRVDYPDLPFVLFTGKGSEDIASDAISAGVTDYLQKGSGTDQYTVLANRITNATRTHRAETAVTRTEERYHNLVDLAPIPIVLLNEDGEILYTNESAVEFMHADSHEQLDGRPFSEFLHPDDRELAAERFERLMSEDVSLPEIEYRLLTVDDEVKTATVATAPGYYRGTPVGQAMVYE